MKLFYTLFRILRILPRVKIKVRGRTESQKSNQDCKSELSISLTNINKHKKTLKFTKSPQQMIKTFSKIKEEIGKILEYNKDIALEFDGEMLVSVGDLKKMDMIQDRYIKDFLNNQIDIELAKEKEVNSIFLKESLIKKALTQALKCIEFLPNDVEMQLRITELEDKLTSLYINGGC